MSRAQKYFSQPNPVYAPQPGQSYRPQPKKKPVNMGLFALIGVGAVVLILIVYFTATSGNEPVRKPSSSPPSAPVPSVNLPDSQKREMYRSLMSLKGMLKATGSSYRAYQILAERYHVPVSTVHGVEAEGNGKGWPQQ